MYIRIVNNIPESYSIQQFRQDHNTTSFPEEIPDYLLEQYNVFPCVVPDMPEIDHRYAKIDGNKITKVGNEWRLEWTVTDKSADEIVAWIDATAQGIRAQRNQLLAETDFYALSDNVMTVEMAEYRKSLRDITIQPGFPQDVKWPIKP